MEDSTLWWVLAGIAVAVELATGTFYLLMLSLGFAAAAMAAHAGLDPTLQLVVGAVVGGGFVLAWRSYKQKSKPGSTIKAEANPDVNLDIGGMVRIDKWQPDGSASVSYRGANWTVELEHGHGATTPTSTGQHRIVAVVGSRLMVKKID